jgi:EmrB/QacA subfamily drug resistance transporter
MDDARSVISNNDSGAPVASNRRRWAALVVLCVGQLMIVLDVTVVNVALPTIQRELHFSQTSLAWVVNAYLLTFGGLLLLAGRLGDIVGRKRIFLAGVASFVVASAMCGFANSDAFLIGARFVQGAAAAFMASMILGIIATTFSGSRERGRAMSVYAFVASSGGSIGLLVGGVLTELLNWHWIFFINVPIGIATLVLALMLIEDTPGLGFAHGVDVGGAVLAVAAPTVAVWAIVHANGWGWTSGKTLGMFALALALVGTFLFLESRIRNPLMPLSVFESRTRNVANAVRSLFAVGLFGAFFMSALYFQLVLGYSAIAVGLAFLPLNLTIGVFSLGIAARVMIRVGPKRELVAGLALAVVALLLFARMPVGGSYVVDILPAMLVFGVAAGLSFTPGVALSMAEAGPSNSGVASGLANVTLQLGAALGLAVLASVSTQWTSRRLAHGASAPSALTSGYHVAFLIGAGCLAMAVLLASTLLRKNISLGPPSEERSKTELAAA